MKNSIKAVFAALFLFVGFSSFAIETPKNDKKEKAKTCCSKSACASATADVAKPQTCCSAGPACGCEPTGCVCAPAKATTTEKQKAPKAGSVTPNRI